MRCKRDHKQNSKFSRERKFHNVRSVFVVSSLFLVDGSFIINSNRIINNKFDHNIGVDSSCARDNEHLGQHSYWSVIGFYALLIFRHFQFRFLNIFHLSSRRSFINFRNEEKKKCLNKQMNAHGHSFVPLRGLYFARSICCLCERL